jgi:hypothetical protein
MAYSVVKYGVPSLGVVGVVGGSRCNFGMLCWKSR